jgi:hypothetical protein
MRRLKTKPKVLTGRVSRVAVELSRACGINEDTFLAQLRKNLARDARRSKASGWKLFVVERDGKETLAGEGNVQADLPRTDAAGVQG